MFNKQLNANIKEIDTQIAKLMVELDAVVEDNEYEMILMKIDDLAKLRDKLSTNKVNESYSKEIVSGVIGMAAIVVVLKHEKADIITSKAFGIATKLFRGV